MQLNEFLEATKAVALDLFKERGELSMHGVVLEDQSVGLVYPPDAVPGSQMFPVCTILVRKTVELTKANAAAIIAEVWTAPDSDDGKSPSQHPNRGEAIMVMYQERGCPMKMVAAAITREGEEATVGEWNEGDAMLYRGVTFFDAVN